MNTGDHQKLKDFFSCANLPKQQFVFTNEYFDLHNYDLESFDRRIAILDVNYQNTRFHKNKDFYNELQSRIEILHSQGFKFIKATPWESKENVTASAPYPQVELPDYYHWTGGVSWFWYYMYRKHEHHKFNFDHTNKKFDFLYLNKAMRRHRVKLYKKMVTEGMLTNALYSMRGKRQRVVLPQEYELPGVDTNLYPRWGMDQDLYELPYNHTNFSLVSETNDNNYEVFMTEKIWKPIIAQQPFVVHGNYLYLQRLREMGFKTFANYFDEGYDLEADADKRIDKIVTTCQDLLTRNWQDIYLQTQSLRKHNLDTFFNREKLSIEINKTLNLFLEFADSR